MIPEASENKNGKSSELLLYMPCGTNRECCCRTPKPNTLSGEQGRKKT